MGRKDSDQSFDQLRQEFNKWVPALKDIQKYVAPTCGFFEGDQPNHGRAIDHKTILDSTAERAIGTLAALMQSGLTSPSRPWFRMALANTQADETEAGRFWLDDSVKRMLLAFAKSNVYGALFAMYEECAAFGTAAFMLLEDFETILRARFFTIGEYYLGVGSDGRVNRFARRYQITVAQIVQEFGIDKCSQSVKDMHSRKQLDSWVTVRHLIEPNEAHVPGSKFNQKMKYKSCYWEEGTTEDSYLRVGGFRSFPIMAPRWKLTRSTDTNGRGPGWYILGDTKMLQVQQKDKLIAGAKIGNPPVQKDSSVSGHANMVPGGVTVTDTVNNEGGVRAAYLVNPNLDQMEASISITKEAINAGCYANLILLMQDLEGDKTKFEIAKRHEEKLLLLGPVLERLQSEGLGPMIERAFEIMLETGQLLPPPPELEGQDLKIEYISLLAQAQQIVGTTAIEQVVAFVGGVAAAVPEAMDNLDTDEAIQSYGKMVGGPGKMMRAPKAVAELREARRKAAAKQEQQAVIEKSIEGAKVLSETPVGVGSALDALLGTPGAPGNAPTSVIPS